MAKVLSGQMVNDNVLVSGWIRAVRGSDRLGSEHVNITMTIWQWHYGNMPWKDRMSLNCYMMKFLQTSNQSLQYPMWRFFIAMHCKTNTFSLNRPKNNSSKNMIYSNEQQITAWQLTTLQDFFSNIQSIIATIYMEVSNWIKNNPGFNWITRGSIRLE